MDEKESLIRETVIWLGAAIVGFCAVFYFDQITLQFNKLVAATKALDKPHHVREPEQESDEWENVIVIHANRAGHFSTRVKINNEDAVIMIDTGATLVALSYETAEKIGIHVSDGDYDSVARTANGITKVAHVEIDEISIGDITLNDVEAIVAEPGKLSTNLLGMNFLSKLKRFEFSGRKLVLVQ